MTALRPYQERVVFETEAALASGDRVILVAPTGSGKTVMGAAVAKHAAEQHRGVLFLAHRREIIDQTSRKLHAYGVRHGVIIAGADDRLRPQECVQVASVATLWSRGMRSDAMPMPAADLIIVDECHHAPATTYTKIIEHYPDARVLGLTATPCRGDGRGLGGHFGKIVEAPQIADLIVEGHLVRGRVYAPVRPDLKGVHTRHGDYVEGELAGRMDTRKLVGDLVSHWLKYGERRRTVVFAVNVAHSLHICAEFQSCGIRAEHLDGATPLDEREAILARLSSGETEVVTNCMVLTEGWDCPEVGCCVLARPTKKMGLFRQMIGRVLRPADGKADAIVLDHSGAVYLHGLPEDPVLWTLDPDEVAVSPQHAKRSERPETSLIECTQCSAMRMGGKPCPACGFMPKRPARDVVFADGNLSLVSGEARESSSQAERIAFYSELRQVQLDRKYKGGWAAHQYKQRHGSFPPWAWNNYPEKAPTPATLGWVKSRQIAYAKARQRAADRQQGAVA
jgi:DNA repair protein RadD